MQKIRTPGKISDTPGLLKFAQSKVTDIEDLRRRLEILGRCLTIFEEANRKGVSGRFKAEHTTVYGQNIEIDVESEVPKEGETNIDVELVAEAKGWVEYTLKEELAKKVLAQREKESAFSDEMFDRLWEAFFASKQPDEDVLNQSEIVSFEVLVEKEYNETCALLNKELED